MQILQHEQHGCGERALGEQRKRLLEDAQLRARGRPVDPPKVSDRAERLDERLVGQLRTDEIDRAPEEDLEALGAGASGELGGQPGLADARLPREEDGQPAPAVRCLQRALELRELACAPDEHLGRASLHPGQYRAATPGWEAARRRLAARR